MENLEGGGPALAELRVRLSKVEMERDDLKGRMAKIIPAVEELRSMAVARERLAEVFLLKIFELSKLKQSAHEGGSGK